MTELCVMLRIRYEADPHDECGTCRFNTATWCVLFNLPLEGGNRSRRCQMCLDAEIEPSEWPVLEFPCSGTLTRDVQ